MRDTILRPIAYDERNILYHLIDAEESSYRAKEKIVEIATKNPREGYGLPFSTWSLRVLAGYVSKELNLVDSISNGD